MREQVNIFPLGDSAATIDIGNMISPALNQKIVMMQQWLWKHSFHGLRDVIIASNSLTIYYDTYRIRKEYAPAHTVFEWVRKKLLEAWQQANATNGHENGNGDGLHFYTISKDEYELQKSQILYK